LALVLPVPIAIAIDLRARLPHPTAGNQHAAMLSPAVSPPAPYLPPELHRDILFWAVGPYARGSLPYGADSYALATPKERERDRRELRDRRLTAIQVCRAWKVRLPTRVERAAACPGR
jgi:hypothetical protein